MPLLVKFGVKVFKVLCRSVKMFWENFPPRKFPLLDFHFSDLWLCVQAGQLLCRWRPEDAPPPKGSRVYDMRSRSQTEITTASGRRGGRAPVEE